MDFVQKCESDSANKMMQHLRDAIANSKPGDIYGLLTCAILSINICVKFKCPKTLWFRSCDAGNYILQFADDFCYTDPVHCLSFSNLALHI
jgi:phosphoglucomutase